MRNKDSSVVAYPVILVLEDLPDHAEMICEELENAGNFITVKASSVNDIDYGNFKTNGFLCVKSYLQASDGEIKVEERNISPDFLILDELLPGKSGLDFWKELGRPQKYVFLTIWSDDDKTRLEFQEAEADMNRVLSKASESIEGIISRILYWMINDGVTCKDCVSKLYNIEEK